MIDMYINSSSSSVLIIVFLMDECDTCYCFLHEEKETVDICTNNVFLQEEKETVDMCTNVVVFLQD